MSTLNRVKGPRAVSEAPPAPKDDLHQSEGQDGRLAVASAGCFRTPLSDVLLELQSASRHVSYALCCTSPTAEKKTTTVHIYINQTQWTNKSFPVSEKQRLHPENRREREREKERERPGKKLASGWWLSCNT